jgi:uncharacterized membrane protein YhhN
MNILLLAAFVFAALEALALWRSIPYLEFIAKPAVMLALFFWLWTSAGMHGVVLWFGSGILFSLIGDILLMISLENLFLPGLVAFLAAHIMYVIGFNLPLPVLSVWGLLLAIMIGLGSARILRKVITPLHAQRQAGLRIPILIYGLVISLMLLSAMLKLTDLSWNMVAALLVALGAFLFYLSDIILAWMKFIAPIQNGRIYNILSYHLGQIALIAGVVIQFS